MAKVTRDQVAQAIALANADPHSGQALAAAVRASLDYLAQEHPGNAVELRVPPYRVIQLIQGITHRRGTPPAVVEVSAENWLKLLTNKLDWKFAVGDGLVASSGSMTYLLEEFINTFNDFA